MALTVLTVIQVISCLVLIISVLLQKGSSQGLSGAISGGAETFFGSHQNSGLDALLAKLTTVFAVVFVVLSLVLCLLGS